MKFDKLTEPNEGLFFTLWGFAFSLNFAKTLLWATQSDDDTTRSTHLFAVNLVESGEFCMLAITMLPVKVAVTFRRNR